MTPRIRSQETTTEFNATSGFGIYCLGSDSMLDWMIGLLESLKEHAPHCRLYVIPFDDNISRLTALQKTYGFEFYHSETLPALEEMARTALGKCAHTARVFRKLSVFWGPLQHFLFLDVDIVVQDSLQCLLDGYKRSGLEFAYTDINIDEVYQPGPLRATMQENHGAQGFNSGCFVSSRGVLTLAQVQAAAASAASVRAEFVSRYEQSFFNYLVDTSGVRQGTFTSFCADYGPKIWAALTPLRDYQSRCWVLAGETPLHPMPMLHWAGYSCESLMPNAWRFLRYRLRQGSVPEQLTFLWRFTRRQRAALVRSLSPRPFLGRCYRKLHASVQREPSASRDPG